MNIISSTPNQVRITPYTIRHKFIIYMVLSLPSGDMLSSTEPTADKCSRTCSSLGYGGLKPRDLFQLKEICLYITLRRHTHIYHLPFRPECGNIYLPCSRFCTAHTISNHSACGALRVSLSRTPAHHHHPPIAPFAHVLSLCAALCENPPQPFGNLISEGRFFFGKHSSISRRKA